MKRLGIIMAVIHLTACQHLQTVPQPIPLSDKTTPTQLTRQANTAPTEQPSKDDGFFILEDWF